MTEAPKNSAVGPFLPAVCFLAQSSSVSEPRAALPATKASFLQRFNSSRTGTALTLPWAGGCENRRTPALLPVELRGTSGETQHEAASCNECDGARRAGGSQRTAVGETGF